MRPKLALLTSIIMTFVCSNAYATSEIDTTSQNVAKLPAKYADKVLAKAQYIDDAITKKTTKYLNKLSELENRITRKLQQFYPSKPTNLPPSSYDTWLKHSGNASSSATGTPPPTNYVPGLDTLKTTLSFLQQRPGSLTSSTQQINNATTQVTQLQGNFNQANLVDQYIQQRRQQLAQVLSQYSNLPASITNEFNQYKATAYYYREQLKAYKDMLNSPDKMEETVVSVLSRVPAYQQFLSRNSLLSSLFAPPPGGGTAAGALPIALAGLQTRVQVQNMIQQQIAPGGTSVQQAVQQQMHVAQNQLSSIKNQIAQYGSSGSGMDLPVGFQPNSQKTKAFLNRIEYGANVQFAQSSGYLFPATANIALTLGYKINDKSAIGAGLAYTAGMGSGWNHIQLSSQAIGLRSYMDWKIKKSYYIIAGYEENYMTQFTSIADLRNANAWQKSALIGLERKYKISAKLQGNVQILFDLLYKEEIPPDQMFKFRVGYNF